MEARPAARAAGKFAAFLSHCKVDAAMEARFLQTELEKLLGRPLQPPMEAALAMARSLVDLGVAVKKRRGKKDES